MQLSREQIRKYWEHRHPEERRINWGHDRVSVRCVLHGEKNASCSLFLDGNGGFYCHACGAKGSLLQFEAAYSRCDLQQALRNIAEITGAKPSYGNGNLGPCVAVYDYRDDADRVVYQNRRYEPPGQRKVFHPYHPNGKGGWTLGLPPEIKRVLFNQSHVVRASTVGVCEGEKCAIAASNANALGNIGHSAAYTSIYGGAKAEWLDSYSPYFTGKYVVIFADNDEPGQKYAEKAAAAIFKYAYRIKIVSFPELPAGGDVADYLESYTVAELEERIKAVPFWKPEIKETQTKGTVWDTAEDVLDGIDREEKPFGWIHPDVPIAKGYLSQIFAPRGLGKSVYTLDMAVKLARAGFRVLVLDRDNPSATVWSRLRNLGSRILERGFLKVITRERCPSLFPDPTPWLTFPFDKYDVVIIDSWNAFTVGLSEKDTSVPAWH